MESLNAAFVCGSVQNGCLLQSLDHDPEDDLLELRTLSTPYLKNFEKLWCGTKHCIALDSEQQVWAWGEHIFEKGKSKEEIYKIPQAITIPILVKAAACGFEHTLFLANTGAVYSVGINKSGQLGLGKEVQFCGEVVQIPVSDKIEKVVTGPRSSFLITDQGKVISFGLNRDGQLGGLLPKTDLFIPTLIPHLAQIVEVHAGFKHTIFKSKSNIFYGFGSDKQNQLNKQQGEFVLEQDLDQVAVTWHNTLFYKRDGQETLIWGDQKFGQTCDNRITKLNGKIKWVGCMSESFLIKVQEEDGCFGLYGWGWNEHGNLGLGDRNNRRQPTKICLVDEKTKIRCGGAFYFLLP